MTKFHLYFRTSLFFLCCFYVVISRWVVLVSCHLITPKHDKRWDLTSLCFNNFQKSEWKFHRIECDALAKLDKDRHKSVTPSIRLMIKLFIRRKLQSEKVKFSLHFYSTTPDFYGIFHVYHMKIFSASGFPC